MEVARNAIIPNDNRYFLDIICERKKIIELPERSMKPHVSFLQVVIVVWTGRRITAYFEEIEPFGLHFSAPL